MFKNFTSYYLYDLNLRKDYPLILGIDEAGRGCVAGPLIVCGLILKPNFYSILIKDSKLIKNIKKRDQLKNLILLNCIKYKIINISPIQIDKSGIKNVTVQAMQLIANELINNYDLCLTDYEKIPNLSKTQINLIKGDATSFTIAAASIVAKSIRDKEMEKLNQLYPVYEFYKNQGYLTKRHLEIVKKYGPIKDVYRFSYKPIKI